jgi:hypothetical protein
MSAAKRKYYGYRLLADELVWADIPTVKRTRMKRFGIMIE